AILALILAITLLPPSDFFKGAFDDPNYRQQAALALCAFIALAAIALARVRGRLQHGPRRLILILMTVMILTGIAGDLMALSVVRAYQIDATVGGGVFAWCICLGASAGLLLLDARRREAALSGTIPELGKVQQ
ncbi:MAG TPA: hypothetical protein VKQ72_03690, partial [Aggregatilineales bacterium]|nr:hypothetical protein [Aggregatilineales bacterium]